MYLPEQNRRVSTVGDAQLARLEERFAKYLDRVLEIVQVKHQKCKGKSTKEVFRELGKVIACQIRMEISNEARAQVDEFLALQPDEQNKLTLNILTGVPLVDLIVNIDWFTAHFEDRSKVLRVIKDLFNHCPAMKSLLKKHSKLIMKCLMNKYDK
jgi:hypothetical protein